MVQESAIDTTQVLDENVVFAPGDLGMAAGDPFLCTAIVGQVNIREAAAGGI